MSTVKATLEEMVESMTGFEEIAVDSQFGDSVNNLLTSKPTMGIRALIFTEKAREEGVNATAAKTFSMEMKLSQVVGYFADDEEEIDFTDPDTDSGKDGSSHETGQLI